MMDSLFFLSPVRPLRRGSSALGGTDSFRGASPFLRARVFSLCKVLLSAPPVRTNEAWARLLFLLRRAATRDPRLPS